MKDIKFDFKDIAIVPSVTSSIRHRDECNVIKYDELIPLSNLPIFTAPMDTVVNTENYKLFLQEKINVCLPRESIIDDPETLNALGVFVSFGISEVERILKTQGNLYRFLKHKYILIDIANGHMQSLVDIIKQIKDISPDTILMVGNIAHPKTYLKLSEAGADYIRCSVGSGSSCTTSANVAINYPLGSLIKECKAEKDKHGLKSKIISDGGIQGYDDILKALALGSDYVMIGSLFNKCIESSGDNYIWKFKVGKKIANILFNKGFTVYKKFRGMSTKEVQRDWKKVKLRTSEGIVSKRAVEYTLYKWVDNFKEYLQSSMSYCGVTELEKFSETKKIRITENAFKRYNK